MKKYEKSDLSRTNEGSADIASVGINLVFTTFIGFGIGYYLDRLFGTSPFLMMLFFVLGVSAGFYNIYKVNKKCGGK